MSATDLQTGAREAADTEFAAAAASVLEQALGGGVGIACGEPRVDVAVADLLPVGAGAVFAHWMAGDEPVCVAIALASSIVETIEGSDAPTSASDAAEAALRAATVGSTMIDDHAVALDPRSLAPSSGWMGVPLLEGTLHVATIMAGAGVEHPASLAAPPPAPVSPEVTVHAFGEIDEAGDPDPLARAMGMINDVEMNVTVELGRARMTVRELLSLNAGSVVELDRAAGSPVDVLVNGRLIARGEVVVVDEEFGIRIAEIVGGGADGRRAP
jgi:flagellar motor switch protein FliN/FliY